MALEIPFGILLTKSKANIDEYYGPYESIELALSSVPSAVRAIGKTIAVIDSDTNNITEYWWQEGVADENLVEKSIVIQSDWDQDDENEDDYIKHRTHYEKQTNPSFTIEADTTTFDWDLDLPVPTVGEHYTIEILEGDYAGTYPAEAEDSGGNIAIHGTGDRPDYFILYNENGGFWGNTTANYLASSNYLPLKVIFDDHTETIIKQLDSKYVKVDNSTIIVNSDDKITVSSNIARTSQIPVVSQQYDGTSTNAQSGTAVAEAISPIQDVIPSSATTENKLVDNDSLTTALEPIVSVIPQEATEDNKLVDWNLLVDSIQQQVTEYVASSSSMVVPFEHCTNIGDQNSNLENGPWYKDFVECGTGSPAVYVTENDYAVVLNDESVCYFEAYGYRYQRHKDGGASQYGYVVLPDTNRTQVLIQAGIYDQQPVLYFVDNSLTFSENNIVFVVNSLVVLQDAVLELTSLSDVTPINTYDLHFPTTRYVCTQSQTDVDPPVWSFVYTVNDSTLTGRQMQVLDSGITTSLVNQITLNQNAIASLATVATTGSYNDLIDKPSIPVKTSDLVNDGEGGSPENPFAKQSEIVQSDWDENDDTLNEHILHRTHYKSVSDYIVCDSLNLTSDGTIASATVERTYDSPGSFNDYDKWVLSYDLNNVNYEIVGTSFSAGQDGSAISFGTTAILLISPNLIKFLNQSSDITITNFKIYYLNYIKCISDIYISNNIARVSDIPNNSNIQNGNSTGSLRSYSSAEEDDTYQIGLYSVAFGNTTKASGESQLVFGKLNIADTSNQYVEIVGNGTNTSNLSNARTLDWDGNEYIAGNLTIGGTNIGYENAYMKFSKNGDDNNVITFETISATSQFGNGPFIKLDPYASYGGKIEIKIPHPSKYGASLTLEDTTLNINSASLNINTISDIIIQAPTSHIDFKAVSGFNFIDGPTRGIKKEISTTECTPDTYYCPTEATTSANPIVFDDTDFTRTYNYTFSGYFTNASTGHMTDMPSTTSSNITITWYGNIGLEADGKYMFVATKVSSTEYVGVVTKLV